MPDSSLPLPNDPGKSISTRTNASSEHLAVIAIGIDGSDQIVGADVANGLDVDVTRVQNVAQLPPALNGDGGLPVHVVNQAAGGGGGDASAANQQTEITRLAEVRDRLPAALNGDGGIPVHQQNLPSSYDVGDRAARLLGHVSVDSLPGSPAQEHTTAASPNAVRLSDGSAFFKPTTPADTQPVSGSFLTDAQLRASSVPVSGPVTDAQLRATPVPVSGTVTANGPLTDAQLRAAGVPVLGPLTDGQLRATPVPVSGTVTASGPVTDAQLRATPVPVSSTPPTLPTATTTGDTGTKTATFAGAAQTNTQYLGALITIVLGTVSGTSPTMACQLQWSPDNGTTWLALGAVLPNLTATNQTGTIAVYPAALTATLGSTVNVATNAPLPRTWRINFTIGGTLPSFALTAVRVNYLF